jgi:fatty-acyl-CoA synthase
MKGYWDEPEKTAETIDKNGWLLTGDIGSMDENGNFNLIQVLSNKNLVRLIFSNIGYVFFKSRAKEVIIRGGVNIYPAEIEVFMRTHEAVMDAYCFGYPDERVGEEVN